MVLRDVHKDMERYLENDCYCPGEIYDASGFFFQVFNADEECEELYRGTDFRNPDETIITVICRNQLINFWVREDKITEAGLWIWRSRHWRRRSGYRVARGRRIK